MIIDYKKELESAAKAMILIYDPNILVKMIVQMIVQKVRLRHAGILLYHKDRDTYVLTVSGGERGLKIPEGFARMDCDNPLIRFYRDRNYRLIFNEEYLDREKISEFLRFKGSNHKTKEFLREVKYQIDLFEAVSCIPSYFQDDLLGILLLGKKISGERFRKEELEFFSALASDVAMALRNAQLIEELKLELEKRKRLFINTTLALAAAIEAKDHYTHGHISRVTDYSLACAEKLRTKKKNDEKFKENLHIAALLHDIGKIGIPESILNKKGKLTKKERRIIEEHPLIGVKILQPIKELGDSILGVKYHHEKYDGSGYPERRKGKDIPLIASIISAADTFDALTSDRSYRKAMSKKEAIEELKKYSGIQFDPLIVKAFVELYKKGKL